MTIYSSRFNQSVKSDRKLVEGFLAQLQYPYQEETDNPAYQQFLSGQTGA